MTESRSSQARSVFRRYIVSLATGALGAGFFLLTGRQTEPSPFLLLLAAVMFSSWYGGVGPALMTTALGTLASVYVYLPPAQALDSAYLRPSVQEGLFVLVALFISYLAADLRRAQGRARDVARQLRRQLDLSSALTRNLGEGLYALDKDGRVTFINPAAEHMLGWTRAEVLGEKLHVLMHEKRQEALLEHERPPALDPFRSQATTHVPLDVFARKDGSLFPVDYVASPIRSGDGVTGMVVAFRDIGDRVRSERRLAAQYAVARELVEHEPLEARVKSALSAVGEGFEWPAGEFWTADNRGTSLLRRSVWHDPSFPIPPVDPAAPPTRLTAPAGLLGRAIASKKPLWTAGPLRQEDSPWLDAQFRERVGGAMLLPVVGRRGPVGVATFFSPESIEPDRDALRTLSTIGHYLAQYVENQQTEHALRASEARFRAIFEGAAVGALLIDTEGRVVMSNSTIQSFLGFTAGELYHRTLAQLTAPDDMPREFDLFKRLVAGQTGQYQREQRYLRKDGDTIWVRVAMSLIRESVDGSEFAVAMVEDISERKAVEQQLTHQALHDALSGLPNRVLFDDRLDHAVQAAHRDNTCFALLLLDVDRFKEVNETLGHRCGDLLLREVAARLTREIPDADTVARLGGDEFAVLLSVDDPDDALPVAERITRALSGPITLDDKIVDMQASIGIALYPDHGQDAATLLRRAEVAMYVAKRSDGGHAVYTLERDQYTPRRLALIAELRHAIERDQLTLHFQPKVSFKTGRIEGVEALVRWQHPERGLLIPDQFIPLAEHTGLIKPLTEWVLRSAVRQARLWEAEGRSVPIAVNLSARSLHDRNLFDTLTHLVTRDGPSRALLQVEITESAVMSEPDRAMDVLARLRQTGITISLDDFGTGYSSLAYLTRLPVDEIKIDKSFVLRMATEEHDAFVARSIVDLGHYLGLQIVAEGVADSRTWDMLASLGCDLAQGFHLTRPLSATAYVDWASHWREGTARQQLTENITF